MATHDRARTMKFQCQNQVAQNKWLGSVIRVRQRFLCLSNFHHDTEQTFMDML